MRYGIIWIITSGQMLIDDFSYLLSEPFPLRTGVRLTNVQSSGCSDACVWQHKTLQ